MSVLIASSRRAKPIFCIAAKDYPAWLKKQPAVVRRQLKGFKAEPGALRFLQDKNGQKARTLIILYDQPGIWAVAGLPFTLEEGDYRLELAPGLDKNIIARLALGWGLGSYQFTRYKKPARAPARLLIESNHDRREASWVASAINRARDLINTPAEDMGPAELAAEVKAVAKLHHAQVTEISGDALLKKNFPLIHAVGRASSRMPRLVVLRWGKKNDPLVALVGKGVCFDSGGLDIKPSNAMYLMKKDMAGAASALAVAEMAMAQRLPLRLLLVIPAVDNAIDGNAFRPSDIFRARNGKTVEIGNTDAEGRLVLADALTMAVEEKPEFIVDFATLTGAARTALGTELPALFANDEKLAADLLAAARDNQDPLWRMPLFADYKPQLHAKIADLNSAPNSPYAGAITAALFLEHFTGRIPWAHIDLMGWHLGAKPGRPEGGEPMGARAVLAMLSHRYKK